MDDGQKRPDPAHGVLACRRCGLRTARAEAEFRRFRNGLSACCGDYLVTTEGPRRIVLLGDAVAPEGKAKAVPRERQATLLWDSSKGPYVSKKHGRLRSRRGGRP